MSMLFGATQRNPPRRGDTEGQRLLQRAAYLRYPDGSAPAYLPLGLRAIRKIEALARHELEAIGGQEWGGAPVATAGPAVAELCRGEIGSYRELPRLLYQVTAGAEDGSTPAPAVLAHSLDADAAGLAAQYQELYRALVRLMHHCAVPVRLVTAVGCGGAHALVHLSPAGDTAILSCDGCGYAADQRIATTRRGGAPPDPATAAPLTKIATPGAATIAELATFLDVPAAATAKALFLTAEGTTGTTGTDGASGEVPVVVIVRGDTELSETKLSCALGASRLRPMTGEEITAIGAVAGYGSAIGVHGATVVVDDLVAASGPLVAGANDAGHHYRDALLGRDYQADLVADVTAVGDGDACPRCGAALRGATGVVLARLRRVAPEVAATYLDRGGSHQPVAAGSARVAVGRLLECAAQLHHDESGLRLPATLAPFHVHLCRLGGSGAAGEETRRAADELYDDLRRHGMEVLYDDRDQRAGVQFADADLMGAPVRVTISARSLAQGAVELRRRGETETELVGLERVVPRLRDLVDELFEQVGAAPLVTDEAP